MPRDVQHAAARHGDCIESLMRRNRDGVWQKVLVPVMGLPLVLAFAPLTAQDEARGEGRSTECVACHGTRGVSENPMFPHLAGQNAPYLQIQLENFRDGTRYHPLMTPVAQSLTDQEIRELAEYFSNIGSLVRVGDASSAGSPE